MKVHLKAIRMIADKGSDKRGKVSYKKWVVKDVNNVGTVLTLWDPFRDKLSEGDVFSLDQFKVNINLISMFFSNLYYAFLEQNKHTLKIALVVISFWDTKQDQICGFWHFGRGYRGLYKIEKFNNGTVVLSKICFNASLI